MTFSNKEEYEGDFKDNKFNGTGTYTKNGKKLVHGQKINILNN